MGITSDSILKNKERVANFTSSNIYRLMGNPGPRKTYIEEKRLERQLGRSLTLDKGSQSTAWGNLGEMRVNDLLGLAYKSVGDITILHQTLPHWSGSPDFRNDREQKGAEVKCFEPKAFAQSVNAFLTGDLNIIKKECPEIYWQGLSNAILLGVPEFEYIFYIPYESELAEIAQIERRLDEEEKRKYFYIFRAINEGKIYEVPFLPEGGYFKNLNIFKFKVEQKDVDLLTTAVIEATKELFK